MASRPQLRLAFLRFLTTAGQSLYVAVRILPRYLNYDTDSIGSPYALKACSEFSLVSVSARRTAQFDANVCEIATNYLTENGFNTSIFCKNP